MFFARDPYKSLITWWISHSFYMKAKTSPWANYSLLPYMNHLLMLSLTSGKKMSPLSGPLWLLQLWLNVVFEDRLESRIPPNVPHHIEGIRLSYLTEMEGNVEPLLSFWKYFAWFIDLKTHKPFLAPFALQTHRPDWFTKPFPSDTPGAQIKALGFWVEFLTTFIFPSTFAMKKVKAFLHQPSLVGRQFGLCQTIPTCLFDREGDIICDFLCSYLSELDTTLKDFKRNKLVLNPMAFKHVFYCTHIFQDWWHKLYVYDSNIESYYKIMTIPHFSQIGDPRQKSNGTHLREIQKFQKKIV